MTAEALVAIPRPPPDLPGAGVLAALDALLRVFGHAAGRSDRLVADLCRDAAHVGRNARALARSAGAARGTVRTILPRAARIGSEVARMLAAYRLYFARAAARDRLDSGDRIDPDAARERLDALHTRYAVRIHAMCAELGGAVLKVGQFASSRADLLPEIWIEALGQLQDRAPAAPYEEIAHVIEAELGGPPDEVFAAFEVQPIAAASLAQVHAAVLHSGARVAVKVQRPGIKARVEADLAVLAFIVGRIGGAIPHVDLATYVAELARSVRGELDYTAEARHMVAFREAVSSNPALIVPALVPELSTRRVLTMERIEGQRLPDFLEGSEAAGEAGRVERAAIIGTLVDAFAAQILGHGLLHADPHPGNFLVCPGPRLAILDFGAMATLPPKVRRAWAELVGATLAGQTGRVAELLNVLGFRAEDGDPSTLVALAEMALEAFRGADSHAGAIDVRAQVERALALLLANPVVEVPGHFVLLSRVLTTLGGLVLRYGGEINLLALIGPHLARALATRPTAIQGERQGLASQ